MKVLFVCLGNICRSPLAEAIFKAKAEAIKPGKHFQADSCGTANYNIGDDPDPRTRKSATKNGVPMLHKARQLKQTDLQYFDLILAMDHHNLRNILSLCDERQAAKVKLMRDFDPAGKGDVPDPYYGEEKDFDLVFNILNRSIDALLKEL